MEDKDKLIASLRQQLRQMQSKCSALEQENALLTYELENWKCRKSNIILQNKK